MNGSPNGRTAWNSNDDDDDDDDDADEDDDDYNDGGYVICNSVSVIYRVSEENISHPCSRDNLEQLENKVLNGWDIRANKSVQYLSFVTCEV
jgi:hypothetical protein